MAVNKNKLKVTSSVFKRISRRWFAWDPRLTRGKTKKGAIHVVNPVYIPSAGLRPALYREYHHGRKVKNVPKKRT